MDAVKESPSTVATPGGAVGTSNGYVRKWIDKCVEMCRPEQVVSHKTNITINLGDTSLLFLDGEPHRRERKLLVPPLHGERITVFGERIQGLTREAAQRWRSDESLDLAPEFEQIGPGGASPA